LLSEYDYVEESDQVRYFIERNNKENRRQLLPPWWDKVHSRLPRGVAKKVSQNINSILSNYHNQNISDFTLRYKSKQKSDTEFILFEDCQFPSFIKKMKSQYWYTDMNGKKQKSTFEELCNQTSNEKDSHRGVEIVYDKMKDHYYFYYPVEISFYPENDRRNKSQVHFKSSNDRKRIISLDPGVRKFMVGYDPNGKMIFIGEGSNKEIIPLLYDVDGMKGGVESKKKWRIIKNRINEMHWKTISYLTRNYDTILLPEFRTSEMVKGKKLTRMTKRLMTMFSFYAFKEKLKFKCKSTNTKLYIVEEEYTSKTCTKCGKINNIGSNERYKCKECGLEIDRDVNGNRNIMIKNIMIKKK